MWSKYNQPPISAYTGQSTLIEHTCIMLQYKCHKEDLSELDISTHVASRFKII